MTLIIILSVILAALLSLGSLILSVYGLYLAFSAHAVVGILVILLQPAPFLLGALGLLGKKEVATQIATWLKLKG